jgi:lysophospholipase L1-like esterase
MTAACTFSITETCTGIDILWCGTGNPGHFRWRIDGGAWTDVNQQVDNYGGRVTPIRGLSAASHTLDVDWVSGVALLEGAMIYNGDEETGVRVWNGARGGAQTVTFSAGGTWWLDSLATVAPELVTIMLGVNDYANNIAVATFSARLQTIITNVRVTVPTAQILLVAPYQAYVAAPAAPWSDYVAAMEAICQADPSVLFTSLVGVFGGYTDPPVGGSALIAADRVHPTPAGHTLIASEIDKAITIAIARGLLDLSIVAGDTGTTFATASNQRVSLPDLAALQFGDTFSISMWVKRASIGTIQRFWTHDAVNGLAFYCKADNTVECQKVGVGSYLVSILPFDDLSTWHHILVTKGGVTSGDAQVYLDRAPMRRTFANQTITNPVGSRYIGYTSQSWDGGIAAVAVFNRVLTTAERMRLGTARTAETQRTAAEDLGASAYYPLGRKTLAVDSGLRVVTLDGVQDRGNLTLASDNEHGEYLRLWRGRNTIRVTGQPTTVRIRRDETYL